MQMWTQLPVVQCLASKKGHMSSTKQHADEGSACLGMIAQKHGHVHCVIAIPDEVLVGSYGFKAVVMPLLVGFVA